MLYIFIFLFLIFEKLFWDEEKNFFCFYFADKSMLADETKFDPQCQNNVRQMVYRISYLGQLLSFPWERKSDKDSASSTADVHNVESQVVDSDLETPKMLSTRKSKAIEKKESRSVCSQRKIRNQLKADGDTNVNERDEGVWDIN